MQYAAPGTEFNVYGDGVYMSDSPLGPYTYAINNPVSYKPGGFMNGAGHGSTLIGPQNTYWHFATMALSLNVNWERRICMFPTYFDAEGLMHTNTYFGDYPHFAPAEPGKPGEFAGWMLLSYKKPVKASSSVEDFKPENLVDENVKSFWLAKENNEKEWVEIDLQQASNVYAIQVNYQDYKSDIYGKVEGLKHRYLIEGSLDGNTWVVLVDREDNYKDVPNDYVELAESKSVRFVRYKNIKVPTTNLAISGLRVFGLGTGKKPGSVKHFNVARKTDTRDAMVTWDAQENVQGYNVFWGIAPDKLYNSWLVYGENELELKNLNVDQPYYLAIEAFNENGVSKKSEIIKID